MTPRLRRILVLMLLGFGVMVIDSIYLLTLTIADWVTGVPQETLLAVWAFLLHVILGLLLVVPVVIYGIGHFLRARHSPNYNARRVGYVLFGSALVLLISGILLLRIEGVPNPFDDGESRDIVWWIHAVLPLILIWLFIAHRMVGPRVRWRVGVRWVAIGAAVLALVFIVQGDLHTRVLGIASDEGPSEQSSYSSEATRAFINSSSGVSGSIPVSDLTAIEGCIECHPDAHASWSNSAHRFSSFDNPVYAAAVRETRKLDSSNHGMSAFCAGCHDPVLLASGNYWDSRLDDPSIDPATIPGATAGVNCLVCHSIDHVEPFGNGSWSLAEPIRYPFHDSEFALFKWLNRQLIRARPNLHKRAMFKPGVTDSALLCGSCHKAWVPEGLNEYRWLPGQNHYDSWRLSGVSGHGVSSWRWPEHAQTDCNVCHMQLMPSTGMAARDRDGSGIPKVHDHLFAAGNTALSVLMDLPDREQVLKAHEKFLATAMRVDIIGLREGGAIDGAFIGPLRPEIPWLKAGETYLLEVVCRNTGTGHAFTQGTADSNEIWLDVVVRSGKKVIGRSGAIDETGVVDPWAYRLNTFTVDAEGNRIENRAPEEIFTNVYNHQVPPGAASVTHYKLEIPPDASSMIEIEVALRYRKFDRNLMDFVFGEDQGERIVKELPAVVVARDRVVLPLETNSRAAPAQAPPAAAWERLYDYGIGLFLLGPRGPMRQAAEAFERVASLGHSEGDYGLGRVYLRQGRYKEAVGAFARASKAAKGVAPWGITYFSGVVDQERGLLEDARDRFNALVSEQAARFPQATARGFNFAGDDMLLLDLAETELRLNAEAESGDFARVLAYCDEVLERNPQSARAWWLRARALASAGLPGAEAARKRHEQFRPDAQAAETAVREARKRYPWADHAAEPSAIYDLDRLEDDAE